MTVGLDLLQQDPETLPVIVVQDKGSGPVMNYDHMAQILKSKKFAKFDHGSEKNIALYGQTTPPEFDLSKIRVPQLFFLGANGYSGRCYLDLSTIRQKYQAKFHVIDYPKFGLADFVQTKDINSLLHEQLIKNVTELESAE